MQQPARRTQGGWTSRGRRRKPRQPEAAPGPAEAFPEPMLARPGEGETGLMRHTAHENKLQIHLSGRLAKKVKPSHTRKTQGHSSATSVLMRTVTPSKCSKSRDHKRAAS